MIVTCPACATRYALDPASLGPEGRRVRCARCGDTWHQPPPADAPRMAPPAPAVEPEILPPGAHVPAIARVVPRHRPAARWALFILAAVGLIAAGFVGRDAVVAAWPGAANLYGTLGVETGADPTAGLELVDEPRSEWVEDGTVLRVWGEIANVSGEARAVPPLQVTALDADNQPLQSTTFRLPAAELQPDQVAPFEVTLPDLDATATRIEITVADAESPAGAPPAEAH